MICLVIKLLQKGCRHDLDIVCQCRQLHRSVAVFRVQPSVKIDRQRPVVSRTGFQAFVVKAHPPGAGLRYQILGEHVRKQHLDHLPEDQLRLLILIRSRKHLPVAQGVAFTLVGLDILHRNRLDTPGVINKNFPIDPEGLIEVLFVVLRLPGDIPHREQICLLQPSGFPDPDLPEICQGLMIPEQELV